MKKTCKRGDFDNYVCEEESVIAVRWNDNSVVTDMSNVTGVHPLHKAKRYSFTEKKKIDISQPDVIHNYNCNMGGVDQLDNNVSNYRIAMRSKKLCMPILLWMLDIAMNNAWRLSRNQGLQLDNLGFRRQVVQGLLQKYGAPPSVPGPFPQRKLRTSVSETSRSDPKIT
ncbi:piggyBac transposable element-derived protein 3-like [Homalodisca vitripennis]|uniref:piggyBac transposable element-derived protein 3-like n=1 Tax=Homalodisca vitripennis TaxID=197043 RepID=UPI001EEA82C8|nr:piggyBac transposable element-derived protein 3-like [Homalodisca vitripennis]